MRLNDSMLGICNTVCYCVCFVFFNPYYRVGDHPLKKREWVFRPYNHHMDVSKNSGTPKSSILIEFSILNHPFWGTPIFGTTHIHPHPTERTSLEGHGSIWAAGDGERPRWVGANANQVTPLKRWTFQPAFLR